MNYLRRIITTNDIALLSGKSIQSAQRLMREMKRHYGKKSRQFITIREFCHYTGVHPSDVADYFESIGEFGLRKKV